jgi:hypothetical protein
MRSLVTMRRRAEANARVVLGTVLTLCHNISKSGGSEGLGLTGTLP